METYLQPEKDKNKGIAVFFERENINTLDIKGELLFTIMAFLAQQESQSISQNVKLGLQYRYQAPFIRYYRMRSISEMLFFIRP